MASFDPCMTAQTRAHATVTASAMARDCMAKEKSEIMKSTTVAARGMVFFS